jgi:hypothetical protein
VDLLIRLVFPSPRGVVPSFWAPTVTYVSLAFRHIFISTSHFPDAKGMQIPGPGGQDLTGMVDSDGPIMVYREPKP